METMVSSNINEKSGGLDCCCGWFKGMVKKLSSKISDAITEAMNIGKQDPRKIIHSLKVGLAICLVSLFYYFNALYEGFGINAMWAVMTVVVVFEFTVGGTLGRCMNRGVATLIAGGLGVGAHRIASFSGEKLEPFVLGTLVFLFASIVSYARFYPKMKARYDYALLIFNLTFSLICVSGYRDDEVLVTAYRRLSTIFIGGLTALVVCVCICPVWAGHDLHTRIALNLEKLATSIEGFRDNYFITQGSTETRDGYRKSKPEGYKDVINSKSTEETMANLARWEPRHGRFRYRHPWEQYLIIGALTRQCACRLEALNGYLNSETQESSASRARVEEPCRKMTTECNNALKELSLAIQTMTWPPPSADSNIKSSKKATRNLRSVLKMNMWRDNNLLEIIPVATVASLLIDIASDTEKIAQSVHKLAVMANFKGADDVAVEVVEQPKLVRAKSLQPRFSMKRPHHVVTIDEHSHNPAE